MRITKEPEERKQEIIETAMRLFHEKGYEKTSIADIAKAIGVAQGLCYRYFPSKEALFDCTIDQYAQVLADRLSLPADIPDMPLKQLLKAMPADVETDDSDFYQVFHEADNKKFHDQLSLKVCEKLVPAVIRLLEKARENGEITIDDIETAAYFCVYGQLGILLNNHGSAEEKAKRIYDFLIYALRL
ncbi:TetR/AcrR family transcriptional regulator [Faecalicatena sp. AGMB00832]|uniref:TetR/AcrR family transcriptional regulator n=1 Tax=Faecalicatena faecalis TaxID=2726362 RepID=A0ABS6D6Y3_9FIRM|nr:MULTISPECIES: TetR/AcrR family transcriptional regulator [Faecalicatena]MBU3877244.1 TetR/AcrR family transcriptional regulator [Faecalicatena faecalis]MCI6467313.1 TetR/AcrR family transcriptional regulator [Faecalicatena sp.]MDY5620318.1 TetR/AcrR family transcriptional regulator [Lachnospiraceae bacterium]